MVVQKLAFFCCFRLPTGSAYPLAIATSKSRDAKSSLWYSWGGGIFETGQISKDNLAILDNHVTTTLAGKYVGIMYDIELLNNVAYSDIAKSFQNTKKAGLKVMVTTSYTSPFTCKGKCSNICPEDDDGLCGTWEKGFAKAMWLRILADTNVDILSPQFYGGTAHELNGVTGYDIGLVNTHNVTAASDEQELAQVCVFEDWQKHATATAEIIPMFAAGSFLLIFLHCFVSIDFFLCVMKDSRLGFTQF